MYRLLTLIIGCFIMTAAPAASVAAQTATAKEQTSLQTSEHTISQRAREIGESLRCVVCQNQSIYESDAPLAEDMRRLVIKRLEQGDSDAEVMAYMRDKYGDFVLLKPPVQTNTYALWAFPFLLLLLGLVWFLKTGQATRQSNESS